MSLIWFILTGGSRRDELSQADVFRHDWIFCMLFVCAQDIRVDQGRLELYKREFRGGD